MKKILKRIGIALVPAKVFEEKMKHAMEFTAAKAEE